MKKQSVKKKKEKEGKKNSRDSAINGIITYGAPFLSYPPIKLSSISTDESLSANYRVPHRPPSCFPFLSDFSLLVPPFIEAIN